VEDGWANVSPLFGGNARMEDPALSGKYADEDKGFFLGERLPTNWELREEEVDSDKGHFLVVDDAPDPVTCLGVSPRTV
jgi:hypothetical protein